MAPMEWPPRFSLDGKRILDLLTGDRFYSATDAALREAALNASVPGSIANKENVIVLKQCASRFLMSSLPAALRERDSCGLKARLESEPSETRSILAEFLVAADTERPLDERLSAIDTLCDRRMGCELSYVEILLRSPAPQIRKHALGLVLDSPDRSELVGVVRHLAENNGDPEFKKESELLKSLMTTVRT